MSIEDIKIPKDAFTDDEIEALLTETMDGDNDSPEVKRAKNAINNAVNSGKLKRAVKCSICKKTGKTEAHHAKGYDKDNMMNVTWLCSACHTEADNKLRAKKRKKDSIQRVDFLELNTKSEAINILTEPFRLTDEGFLTGRAIVTNVGVFPYLNSDGSIRRELRSPEEVLKAESFETLKNKVVTNNHPDEQIVDVSNVNTVQVGFLGDSIKLDAYHIAMPITITDNQTIEDIIDGKRALSCGYTAQYENTKGNWMGVAYDGKQKNIKYNHVAVVDRGRAGDAARMRFDSADIAISADIQTIRIDNNKEVNDMSLKNITLDGVQYQAEGEVIKTLTQRKDKAERVFKENEALKKTIEQIKSDMAKIEAERDTLQDTNKKLKEENEKKLDTSVIQEAVQKRVKILAIADMAGVEVKADTDEKTIKSNVILKVFPQADLEKKSDEYISARFDGAAETLETSADAKMRKTKKDIDDSSTSTTRADSDEARKKMITQMYYQSRGITTEGGK